MYVLINRERMLFRASESCRCRTHPPDDITSPRLSLTSVSVPPLHSIHVGHLSYHTCRISHGNHIRSLGPTLGFLHVRFDGASMISLAALGSTSLPSDAFATSGIAMNSYFSSHCMHF